MNEEEVLSPISLSERIKDTKEQILNREEGTGCLEYLENDTKAILFASIKERGYIH